MYPIPIVSRDINGRTRITISQKKYLMGTMAVRRLIDRIEGAKPGQEYIL